MSSLCSGKKKRLRLQEKDCTIFDNAYEIVQQIEKNIFSLQSNLEQLEKIGKRELNKLLKTCLGSLEKLYKDFQRTTQPIEFYKNQENNLIYLQEQLTELRTEFSQLDKKGKNNNSSSQAISAFAIIKWSEALSDAIFLLWITSQKHILYRKRHKISNQFIFTFLSILKKNHYTIENWIWLSEIKKLYYHPTYRTIQSNYEQQKKSFKISNFQYPKTLQSIASIFVFVLFFWDDLLWQNLFHRSYLFGILAFLRGAELKQNYEKQTETPFLIT